MKRLNAYERRLADLEGRAGEAGGPVVTMIRRYLIGPDLGCVGHHDLPVVQPTRMPPGWVQPDPLGEKYPAMRQSCRDYLKENDLGEL